MMKTTVLTILPWIEQLRRWTSERRCFNNIIERLSRRGTA